MAFSITGFIIALAIILPFVLVLIFCPRDCPKRNAHNWFFTILTYLGLITSAVILSISAENFAQITTVNNVLFWLTIVCALAFVAVWINYFVTRKYSALLNAFGVIPLPIALCTILPLCLLSAYIQQFLLWIGALGFAVGIIGNNLLTIFNNTNRPPHNKHGVNSR